MRICNLYGEKGLKTFDFPPHDDTLSEDSKFRFNLHDVKGVVASDSLVALVAQVAGSLVETAGKVGVSSGSGNL
ncbi:unnamed protein product [Linum trigynum]|uniref:Uncharacterized protein n=1 Tax=Linum trigynum TaxID=586398 RepID=A0AAV2DVD1_9ROSI